MFCKNCGAEIADNAVFCPKCGGKVSQPSNQGTPVPPQNTQQYGGQNQQYGYQHGSGYNPPNNRVNGNAGKVMLIVAGILVLIGGIITLVSDLQSLGYLGYFAGTGFAGAIVFEIIFSIVMLNTGICALVWCGRKDKADLVFKLGITVVVMRVIDWIWAAAIFAGFINPVTAGAVILGFICPILIVVGAYLNKKA